MRQSKGLTQSQLAEWVGVKRQAIYDIESGRYLPNTGLALRLAKHLGCTVEDLFVENPPEQVQPVRLMEEPDRDNSRVAVAKVRDHFVAYPLAGRHSLDEGFRAADGLLTKGSNKVRLLRSENSMEKSIVLLGCDPAFSILKEHVSRSAPEVRMHCRFASSHRALEGLGSGHAHLAGTHLHNAGTIESNAVLAKSKLGGIRAILFNFSLFEEGLMVAPGNPYAIRAVTDLANTKVRLINREPGAALRVLLDDCLNRTAIPGDAITGYDNEILSHFEGAQMVSNNSADVALGLRAVADAFGLDFVGIIAVRCDLVVPVDLLDHPSIKIILDTLQSRKLREELSMLPGYDTSKTGEVITEV